MSGAAHSGEQHAALDPLSIFDKEVLIMCIESFDPKPVVNLHELPEASFLTRVGDHAVGRSYYLRAIGGTDIDAFVHF